ncbi:hypothetical protein LCGC14_2739760 [marine sediment metagenome]|uniref:Uncharacterized protein n=1 Tax=marine sediment metagenome TaxID=412755 RepID=A0A0F8Z4S6_9ZZZZ
MNKTFSGKVGSGSDPAAPEGSKTKEEYLTFINNNRSMIEGMAETSDYEVHHESYVVRQLARFALMEIKK